jgi:fructosamine-3-kinase
MNHTGTTDRSQMFYWQTDRPFTPEETKSIFLDRHQTITKEELIRAIEVGMRQAGHPSSVASMDDILAFGSVNVVVRAVLADGTAVIVRAHPPGVPNGYFWAESIATRRAKTAGVPTYDTYYIDDSMTDFPFAFMLMEAIPGVVMSTITDMDPERDTRLIEHTGELLAKIHSVNVKRFGYFDNRIARETSQLIGNHERWEEHLFAAFVPNMRFLLDTGIITRDDVKKIDGILHGHNDLLIYTDPRLIHNDVADWNVRCDGDHIVGVLDWDECYGGDPVADFSAWSVFFPYTRMEHLKTGYQRVVPLPEGFEEKLHLYRIRYIVSKMVGRKGKIIADPTRTKYQEMLDYAIKILHEEFAWYGV